MKSLPKLSPTSYALLGLLARAPTSAYELNSIMQNSMLRVFWPRAESHIYSEPKKLLAHGYVSEKKEKVNGRQRTVFSITPAGQTALAKWLTEEDDGIHRSQAEFMLKVILAESGTPADTARTVNKALETSRTEIQQAIAGIEQVLENQGLATLGMPWNGIASGLMADILIARYRWAQQAGETIAGVPEGAGRDTKETLGRAAYEESLARLRAVLAE